jgi:hypothetical protein
LGDADQAEINEQTDQLFWKETGYKEGEKLDPKRNADDRQMAQDWLRLRAHVVHSRQQYLAQPNRLRQQLYDLIPPAARPFMFGKGSSGILEPKDFVTALRIANQIASLTEAERAEYLARVTGTTDSWEHFEQAIDPYVAERQERGAAAEAREDAKTELFGMDEVYRRYRAFKQSVDARAAHAALDDLNDALKPHGFDSVEAFEAWLEPRVAAFEAAFEKEGLLIANEMLDRYSHILYVERERILVPQELDIFYGTLTAAGDDLEPLAVAYPLLEDEELRDHLKGALTKRHALGIILSNISERKEHIANTRNALKENHELMYGFNKLRQHAMLAQGIEENSIYHQLVMERYDDIERKKLIKSFMLAVIAIGAGLLTGGGGTVAVLGAATAAAISFYETLEEYRRYEVEHSAHKAGLLADDPTIAWVIVAALGAGLDFAAAGKAARALKPALKSFDETGDVAKFAAAYDDILKKQKQVDAADVVQSLEDAKQSILNAGKARAREQLAWGDIFIPAKRVNDILAAGTEAFVRFVTAVFTTIQFHGRSLSKFLKTQQARGMLGDLAINPTDHPEHLAALREGFLAALETAETIVNHANQLRLRDSEIENWFHIWAEHPGLSVDGLLAHMDKYAEPLKANAGSKYRYATKLMTDEKTRKVLQDFDLHIAGRGAIEKLTARKTAEGGKVVTIEGRALPSIKNRAKEAPNFNKTDPKTGKLITAEELGLSASDWEWAHLWGPGWGDEAAAGLTLAPREVNQVYQGRGLEKYVRKLAQLADKVGAEVRVKASATSWANPTPGGWETSSDVEFLKKAEYKITLELPDGRKLYNDVVLDVAEPPLAKLLSKELEGPDLEEWLEAYAVGAF